MMKTTRSPHHHNVLGRPHARRVILATSCATFVGFAGVSAVGATLGSRDGVTSLGSASSGSGGDGWTLKYSEDFDTPLGETGSWVVDPQGEDSPWHVDEFDDDGEYFQVKGGEEFTEALGSVDILRKRTEVGEDGWLTIEHAAQDRVRDGVPDNEPSLDVADGEATINIPGQDAGLVLTATDTLPDEYRIEYDLTAFDFGGKRDGDWEYDGKFNGYEPGECKTNFPWVREGTPSTDPCEEPWGDVTSENGFYMLSIMDYAKPAPHNNIFIHSHRKVGMDTYSVSADWSEGLYQVCDPSSGELYPYEESDAVNVNQSFFDGTSFRNPDFAYSEYVMPTDCGLFVGNDDTEIVAAAEMQPEVLPEEKYTFAIERTKDSYVTEMSGNFANVGNTTLRYEQPFISEDGTSVLHYNQTAEEYNGSLNQELTFSGPHGEFTKEIWPEGSAYPDNFLIGFPHLNYYEGSAGIDNLKLYTR
ncbi:MAG: hypothetical protein L0J74_00130 [Corynebacterium sp.]|uniref:hypothetical protein n=1 Tax=Corynebacterium sp. TaxID=1720 RepID=UPI002648EB1E|nr:hypothetical protein [Corynebacterium sp.]MDN6281722.1 hypothetical protein [Corynebacterium sp.]MDN6304210.1 hypothetical protein [Corynebacterium sp.]MDN6367507.1 hypothetical protein [Corynebacterium sp.]MDN6374710.1 hypothetical protein [Corynebacterium sp.]MDN6394812.1 hypothetical protein [Corynebacterium sp.]